jgi:hypothetical protein
MARPRTLFAGVNLIGDTVTQTPALHRYRRLHPDEEVHWLMQDGPARALFEDMAETGVCDQVLFDADWERIRRMDYGGYGKRIRMDVQEAFRIGGEQRLHIAQAYGRMIGAEVGEADILPHVPVRPHSLGELGVPPRCLVISPLSASNAPVDGMAGNKNLPWAAWGVLIERFVQAGRIENYVVLLRDEDPAPTIPLCVLRLSLPAAVAYIAQACAGGGAYAGVDNGMTHLAAGLRAPTFCVYPQALATGWVGYAGFDHYRLAQTRPWQGDVDHIWSAWRTRL